jgi:hypothetical protein
MHVHQISTGEREVRSLSAPAARSGWILIVVGVAVLCLALVLGARRGDAYHYFFHSYLVSFCFYLSIALGGLFFVALQHASRAGWSVAVRRVAEVIAANTLVMAILFLPILVPLLLGNTALYHWLDRAAVAEDHVLFGKRAYLDLGWFVVRAGGFFLVWGALVWYFWRRSLQQDVTGDAGLTLRMERVSYPALLLFGVTITFAAFDWIMSLTPHWYSTIFGVYYFSGAAVGFLAAVILALFVLQQTGHLTSTITLEHYHELGKLLFAFVVFWGYIAFSQYMLIWYANIPEETAWYLPRQRGPWVTVSVILLLAHLFVPFFGLMSRGVKRRPAVLAFWAAWLLAAHWLDVHYLIMPNVQPTGVPVSLIDLCCMAGMGVVFVAGLLLFAGRRSLTPTKDPRLGESLGFENT